MKLKWSIAVAMIACTAGMLLSVSCSPKTETPLPDHVAAVIGDRVITTRDMELEAAQRMDSGLPALNAVDLLNRMLTREALLQQADAEGLRDDPEIKQEVERLLVARIRDRNVVPLREQVSVSDEELASAYQERIGEFTKPALHRFAVLYLQKGKADSETKTQEIQARMEEAYAAAQVLVNEEDYLPGAGFGSLSIHYSDDAASRYRGGDIGWIADVDRSTRISPDILQQALNMEIGELSPITEMNDAWYLVMRTDERPSVVTALKVVAPSLKRRLIREKQQRMEDQYYTECVQAAAPQINPSALERLNLQAPERAASLPTLANGM